MKAKHQRLILALLALGAMVGAGLLAAYALREQASYFYTPSQIAGGKAPVGKAIRIGGMVTHGSIRHADDGVTTAFVVQDGTGTLPVRYKGILPDLFVEGSGVVADGRLGKDGVFRADGLLAKHDENYVPRELHDIDARAARKSADTLVQ